MLRDLARGAASRKQHLMTHSLQAQQWAASVNVGAMSARGAGVLSGMSSTLLTAAQGKALKAGTESFVGKGSALFSNVREKLSGAKPAGR